MKFVKDIITDEFSEKITNWLDFIYELVKEKSSKREFKIEFILAQQEGKTYQVELNEIKGIFGHAEQIGEKTLHLKAQFQVEGISLKVKGDKIVSAESTISCEGWVSDILKDPYLKLSIKNPEKGPVNKNSFIIYLTS